MPTSTSTPSAAAVELPAFKATAIEKIPVYTQTLRDSFVAGKTRSLDFRISQLQKFYWALKDREEVFLAAARQDLGKSAYETLLTEWLFVLNDIIFACENVRKWARPEKLDGVDFTFSIMKPTVRKDPLGTILVIG
ncbi:hypothetical protein KEM52_002123 [Ascosphaera acerosa]|nr:hypothetical protein KEM52_002123 [Ascosphaera acerosa]